MSNVFKGLRSFKRYQRLSIKDIHKYWNQELHRKAGHRQHPAPNRSASDKASWLDVAAVISTFGKWVDQNGEVVEGETIENDLVEFVERGDLTPYVGQSPDSKKCVLNELRRKNFVTRSNDYHIDRDELGRFLVENDIGLPSFWFDGKDIEIYQDQLGREELALVDIRSQSVELLAENESLKAKLLDAMPFMNSEHPYYSRELEAAVALWSDSYGDKEEGAIVRKKPSLEKWLNDNRVEAVSLDSGAISKAALERISMVVNPNKIGGRPSVKS